MALIGNQLSSSENNSYRVLDNLSSFTLTFDGSSSANVLASTDTIALSQHPFITGQRVTYSSGGGSPIGGLLSGTAYYITKTDQNSFKLASSYVNAITNINIDLVGTGTGVTHSFNVAFDGINTKFKATYSNGTKCTISRAAQLDIAINGVVQQPYDSNPPPNGFTIEADATIVFSTAPLAGYTFWGKALSGSTASVENSDNSIDNFTGNGSTTNFTLSKTPANSQNVLVTINGVTQYPSDATGTRSYSTNANVLAFTAAPANGSLIQVRYIGFAGPTSSNVTGFYGRTGNVVLNSSDGIGVGTAKIGTGIVGLATALLVEGNVRITGILTIGTSSITFDGRNDRLTVGTGVTIGVSSIQVGNTFLSSNGIGLGATTNTGRNAGINTAAGTLIYNSSNQQIEVYSGTQWIASYVSQFIQAVGGTISDYTSNGVQWRAHIFNSSGTLNVSNAPVLSNTVEYLVVAGGGGGGNGPAAGGGGGGAGGVRLGIGFTVTAGTYSVTVGSGGGQSANGTPSSISNPTSSITATAGGSGGGFFGGLGPPSPSVIGAPGGSGGGGGAYSSSASVGPGGNGNVGGALYGLREGNPGGSGFHTPGVYAAFGGGGGANGPGIPYSAPGTPGGNASGGRGGDGIPTSISGISSSYGGGGGGGGHPPGGGVGGSGGSGGGGAGSSGPGGTNGTTNTGGGGGGTSHPAANTAGSGGSGIVIVRYQIGQLATKATGGTVSYVGGKTIHTFTSLSSFTVVDPGLTSVEVLQVAGGGSGGAADDGGGGGGAGGLVYNSSAPVSTSPGSYIITVGSGGAGVIGSPGPGLGNNGSPTVGIVTTCVGGGGGGGQVSGIMAANPGGSGGGGGQRFPGNTAGNATSGQGNPGGAGSTSPGGDAGGGGGGAGSAGGAAVSTNVGGNGGNGLPFSISGTSATYAGGGGGAGSNTSGSGGSGGGGSGGPPVSGNGTPGTINTGGGGGGGNTHPGPSANGGSGIVIIAYPS